MEGLEDEDSNLVGETQDQFILLASQEETQDNQSADPDTRMKHMLNKLPELQDTGLAKSHIEGQSDSCTEDDKGARVLVTDTDSVYETEYHHPSDYVSETDPDRLEETVIHRQPCDVALRQTDHSSSNGSIEEEKTVVSIHTSQGSSFHSNSRSNLASYDQCEVYKTQQGHARGSKFEPKPTRRASIDLDPSSQTDLFEEQEKVSVSTPAEHLGSLQVSQKPMLVPETLDADEYEIPPSPGLYSATPMIIPCSPTADTNNQSDDNESNEPKDNVMKQNHRNEHKDNILEQSNRSEPKDNLKTSSECNEPKGKVNSNGSDESAYDILAESTFASDRAIRRKDKEAIRDINRNTEVRNEDHLEGDDQLSWQSIQQSQSMSMMAFDEPTMVESTMVKVKPHSTDSHDQSLEIIAVEEGRGDMQPAGSWTGSAALGTAARSGLAPVSSQKLLQASDVIIIPSGSVQSQEEGELECDEYGLRLSLTQTGSTQGQHSPTPGHQHKSPTSRQQQSSTIQRDIEVVEQHSEKNTSSTTVSHTRQTSSRTKPSDGKIDVGLSETLQSGNKTHVISGKVPGGWLNKDKQSGTVENDRDGSNRKTDQCHPSPSKTCGSSDQCCERTVVNSANTKKSYSQNDSVVQVQCSPVDIEGERSSGVAGRRSRSSSESKLQRLNRKPTRAERLLREVNDNPLVKWKEESDSERKQIEASALSSSNRFTGEFRLAIPSDSHGDTHGDVPNEEVSMVIEAHRDGGGGAVSMVTEGSHVADIVNLEQANRDESVAGGDVTLTTVTPVTRVPMSIDMIQSESEPVTQPTFRLERPLLGESEMTQDPQEESANPTVLPAASNTPRRRQHLIHDSDDEAMLDYRPEPQLPAEPRGPSESPGSLPVPSAEMLVAHRINTQQPDCPVEEACDIEEGTQTYNPVLPGPLTHTDLQEIDTHSHMEISTQTDDRSAAGASREPFEGVDERVVQKVAEYLTTGHLPRSRASSSCTEVSDPALIDLGSEKGDRDEKHEREDLTSGVTKGDKSDNLDAVRESAEKDSENAMRTPQSVGKMPGRIRTPIAFRRQSSQENRTVKSPQEIKMVIQTYTDILAKEKAKQKRKELKRSLADSMSPSSQFPNPEGGERRPESKLIPRRLSTQSLPEDVLRKKSSLYELQSVGEVLEDQRTPQKVNKAGSSHSDRAMVTMDSSEIYNVSTQKIITPKKVVSSGMHDISERSELVPQDKSNILVDNKGQSRTLTNVNLEAVGSENRDFLTSKPTLPTLKSANIGELAPTVPSASVVSKKSTSHGRYTSRHTRERSKKLLSIEKRNEIRKSLEQKSSEHKIHAPSHAMIAGTVGASSSTPGAQGPASGSSAAMSGSFVEGTQRFAPGEGGKPADGGDPYRFEGSQLSPDQMIDETGKTREENSHHTTPLSFRKRQRSTHKKSGLKQAKLDTAATPGPAVTSPSSECTVTTTTSSSLPSSISQASSGRDTVTSPSHPGTIGRQMSSDRAMLLADTLPLHSEEDQELSTIVTERVERVYTFREITITKKITSPVGRVVENTTDVHRTEPVLMKENSNRNIEYRYIPSPSRSLVSLTSGDLGDVSSSLSRSSRSAGNGSLGSKVSLSSASSSLDHSEALSHQSKPPESQMESEVRDTVTMETARKREAGKTKSMEAPSVIPKTRTPRVPSSEAEKSGTTPAAPKSSTTPGASKSGPAVAMDNSKSDTTVSMVISKSRPVVAMDTSKSGITVAMDTSKSGPMVAMDTSKSGPVVAMDTSRPETPVQSSDPEHSDVVTPLGSTINKTGSYLHSRTVSVESPKVTEGVSAELVSEELTAHRLSQDNAMETSSGLQGSRVLAKWKDGFYYPGELQPSPDNRVKHEVRFDDGDNMMVKSCDILLISRLPLGQSVMVLTKDGDFEFGLVVGRTDGQYTVETDGGEAGSYSRSQVILSTDQASCIISDHGSHIMLAEGGATAAHSKPGEVSLDNLLDTPRRSATKQQPKTTRSSTSKVKVVDEGQRSSKVVGEAQRLSNVKAEGQRSSDGKEEGQRSKGRKRKSMMKSLKPQATSTPTPKGKMAEVLTSKSKKRKVTILEEADTCSSPIVGIENSPSTSHTKRSPKKPPRVGLFACNLGPIPKKPLFAGMYFLLTNVDKTAEQRSEEKKLLQDSSLESSTDDSATEEEAGVPFDKDHLRCQIEAGQGTIIDAVDDSLVCSKKKVVLLSSTYQRTMKYLQCLALGVSCLSHMWLVHSCTQGKLLEEKSYVLPAGISLEKRKVMEWKGKKDIFQGVKAVVFSKNTKFADSWSAILRMGQCKVHKSLQYAQTDVIITDTTCTSTVQRQAEHHGIPLVSTEWVIQCLVNGRTMKYDSHPRYRYDLLV